MAARAHKSDESKVVRLPGFDDFIKLPENSEQKAAGETPPEADKSFSLREAKAEMDRLKAETLREARAEAEKIIGEAKGESERIRENAYAQGMEAGRRELSEAAETVRAFQQSQYEALVASVLEKQDAMFGEIKTRIIDVIIQIARKVLFLELERDNQAMVNMIENALANISSEEKKKILLSRLDYERFIAADSQGYIQSLEAKGVAVEISPDLNPGDCIADYGSGTVNVGVNKQIKRTKYALDKEFQS